MPAGTLAADCPKCGAKITLTALETKPIAGAVGMGIGIAIRGDAGHPPPEALLGEELGGYRLKAILGGGGMGVVYEAERTPAATSPGPQVAAVKVLSSVFANDPEFVERFRREADALIGLRHANLIEVYAKGEWRSTSPASASAGAPSYFFVMERFFGEDLRSLMARGAPAPATAAAIVRGAAAGLAFAHQHGIVHRDVKPANILVRGDPAKDGEVKVVDFGVAQLATGQYTLTSLTRSHLILGTINYMSPEQRIDASEIDHRADVYALGVVAYELLTGRLPIGAFEPPSELAGVPRATDRAVMAALRRDPAHRPESALAFAELLDRALVARRGRARWVVGAGAGAALAVAVGGAAWMAIETPVAPIATKKAVEEVRSNAQSALATVQKEERKIAAYVPPDALKRVANAMRTATELGQRALNAEEAKEQEKPKGRGKTKKPKAPPKKMVDPKIDSWPGMEQELKDLGTKNANAPAEPQPQPQPQQAPAQPQQQEEPQPQKSAPSFPVKKANVKPSS